MHVQGTLQGYQFLLDEDGRASVEFDFDPAKPASFIRAEFSEPLLIPESINVHGNGTTVTIVFSSVMDESSATDPQNYQVSHSSNTLPVASALLMPDGRTVVLTSASPLDLDSPYNVTVNHLTASNGQPLATGTTGGFRTWDDSPDGIKVFILAGQSNMVGYGHSETGNGNVVGAIGSLRHLAVNNASHPEYDYTSLLVDHTQPVTSAWKTRGDVKVWWRDGTNASLGGPIRKGDLGPPFQGANANWFGPEYAFGQLLGDFYPDDDILIIKTAWGGHSLGGNFRPPGAVAKLALRHRHHRHDRQGSRGVAAIHRILGRRARPTVGRWRPPTCQRSLL